jgi:Coenzyme PQQ synthesis protein D (PqqD)
MLTRSATVERAGDLVTAPMGEELAMMDMTAGTYFVLDEVAAFIWERLEGPTTVAELCSELERRYDVAPSRCEVDVLSFLESLRGKGLLRVVA